MQNNNINVLVGLATAALFYTTVGLVAAFVYRLTAPGLELPVFGLGTFLGLWWLWILMWIPQIVLMVSVFRATDPVAQMLKSKAEGHRTR